jgi:hypothetical protein
MGEFIKSVLALLGAVFALGIMVPNIMGLTWTQVGWGSAPPTDGYAPDRFRLDQLENSRSHVEKLVAAARLMASGDAHLMRLAEEFAECAWPAALATPVNFFRDEEKRPASHCATPLTVLPFEDFWPEQPRFAGLALRDDGALLQVREDCFGWSYEYLGISVLRELREWEVLRDGLGRPQEVGVMAEDEGLRVEEELLDRYTEGLFGSMTSLASLEDIASLSPEFLEDIDENGFVFPNRLVGMLRPRLFGRAGMVEFRMMVGPDGEVVLTDSSGQVVTDRTQIFPPLTAFTEGEMGEMAKSIAWAMLRSQADVSTTSSEIVGLYRERVSNLRLFFSDD